MRAYLFLLTLIPFIVGCSVSQTTEDLRALDTRSTDAHWMEISQKANLEVDDYKNQRQVKGPIQRVRGYRYFIRALDVSTSVKSELAGLLDDPEKRATFEERTAAINLPWIFQIYIASVSPNWRFLRQAYDKEGNRLKTRQIDRIVHSGSALSEHLALEVDRSYLEQAATSGLDIRIDGRRGDLEVYIPAFYVRGFLHAFDDMSK